MKFSTMNSSVVVATEVHPLSADEDQSYGYKSEQKESLTEYTVTHLYITHVHSQTDHKMVDVLAGCYVLFWKSINYYLGG